MHTFIAGHLLNNLYFTYLPWNVLCYRITFSVANDGSLLESCYSWRDSFYILNSSLQAVWMRRPLRKFHPSVLAKAIAIPVSYTHLRAHETGRNLVCRLL